MEILSELLKSFFNLLIFPGFIFLLFCSWFLDWLDRKIIARIQGRVGPPWFQPIADFFKLLGKEDILPTGSQKFIATLLPVVSLASVMTAALYVPVAGYSALSFEGDLIVVLFLLSIPTLAYFLAGWVSVGVYSLLGGHRSLLQFFSYEVPFILALNGPAIMGGSWQIARISSAQSLFGWFVFIQPLGFVLAMVGLIGKLKRDPLDIPKAKSEILAGPLIEFTGRKLALWHMTLNMQSVVGLFLIANMFLGGNNSRYGLASIPLFVIQTLLLLSLLSITSSLFARLRIDQLANLGWKILVPLSLIQLAFIILMGA
ncbi:MAG: NADH-quinone oxidoreductase subunit H [Anaerolineaceae bacterium]|nr:NADH-quinone oxidoreductase subunit H [Anaerolineaceae bacterium]